MTASKHPQPRPHKRRAAIGVLCAIAWFGVPSAAQPAGDMDAPLAVLRDSSASVAALDAAADTAVSLAARAEPARALIQVLTSPESDPNVKTRVLAAIARSWEPPGRLYSTLLELAEHTDPTIATGALRAIAAYRTPVAARFLLSCCRPDRVEATRQAAFASLAQMTGRDDLGSSVSAWTAWLNTHARLRTSEWQSALAQGAWRRALRLDAERSALLDRATEGYRRLYLALPPPPALDRPRLVIQLLKGDQPLLRDLAFELLGREVSAGSPIDTDVAEAAMGVLSHPDAAARAKAAELTLQVSTPEARARLSQALVTERDPAVAALLLPAAARWPDVECRPAVLSWLTRDGEPRSAAMDAAYALLASGMLESDADRASALAAVRRTAIDRLPSAGYRLLVELGEASDREAVTDLLNSDSPATRAAAAEALVSHSAAWSRIVDAARVDPTLFDTAVRATIATHPDAEGLIALEALPAPSEETRRDGMLLVAAAVSVSDLLRVALRPEVDAAHRQALLTRLLEHGPSMGVHDPRDVAAGLLLLAETNLKLGRPDQALSALEALPPDPPGLEPARVVRTRAIALVWTNRLDQAAELDAPVSAWLEALDLASAEPHARDIIRQIRDRFGRALSPQESLQLESLAKRVSAQTPETPTRATVPDSPEHR